MKVFVKCMEGIGDTLYARPFIKQLVLDGHDVYLRTPLTLLFSDLDVKFVKPDEVKYRTQKRAFNRYGNIEFHDLPKVDREIDFFYGQKELNRFGILSHMEQAFGYELGSTTPVLDLPTNLAPHSIALPSDKRVAIVKPVTHRKEWLCTSRSPKPQYVAWCARMLRDAGYYVISIADTVDGQEWIDGDEPPAHLKLHRGELGLAGTLSLIKDSHLVVGGSGFILPATIAAKTNLFVIFGGRGEYDNPHKVFDLRMNLRKIGWALPDNFCRCCLMDHDCDKTISNLDSQFFNFMRTCQ